MEIYRLTSRGEQLSHSYRSPRNPLWGVIFYLKMKSVATKEQILEDVEGATSTTLTKLRLKKIIAEETGVNV